MRNYHNKDSLFVFLSFVLLVKRTDRTGGPILTIHTSYDVLSHKDVPFGVSLILLSISGVEAPKTVQKGEGISIFKPNSQNITIAQQ